MGLTPAPRRAGGRREEGGRRHRTDDVGDRSAQRHAQALARSHHYTRSFIISAVAGLPDLPTVTQRLLRNQDDIGAAIKPIYGDEAGKKLAALLRDHILIAADITKAAKASDSKAVEAGQKKWRGNADDIATFLAAANPNWKKPTLTDHLYKHLDYVTAQVVARIKADWPADIQAYDTGNEHMLMFADELSEGIIKQNPKKIIISER